MWLAQWPKDGSYRYETTIHGDYVRLLVERAGSVVDFDVGTRRRALEPDQEFWEGRIPLDFEV